MAYQLQLLRNLIERHPERAGNLELHVRALEQSIEELPFTCLSNVRSMFEAMQLSVNGVLKITYGDGDDFAKRTSLVIKSLDLALGDHPQKDKIDLHLKRLLGSINGAASSLAALSNVPNLRHGGALDWPTLERQHAYMLGGLCDALVSFLLDVAWSRLPRKSKRHPAQATPTNESSTKVLITNTSLLESPGRSSSPAAFSSRWTPLNTKQHWPNGG